MSEATREDVKKFRTWAQSIVQDCHFAAPTKAEITELLRDSYQVESLIEDESVLEVEFEKALQQNKACIIYTLPYTKYSNFRNKNLVDLVLAIDTPVDDIQLIFNTMIYGRLRNGHNEFEDPLLICAIPYCMLELCSDVSETEKCTVTICLILDPKKSQQFHSASDKSTLYNILGRRYCVWRGMYIHENARGYVY